MRCGEVINRLENLSPTHFSLDWDNVGLLVGSAQKEVSSVMLALDATETVIDQAILMEADLLITHHPLIFHGLKKVTDADFVGRRVMKLVQNDIACYAMHTNFDVMGMADEAADRLGLSGTEVLDVTWEDEISREGMGRVGFFAQAMALRDCAQLVKDVFELEAVRVFGDAGIPVRKVAVVPGSGAEYAERALAMGADALITGDVKHHDGVDAVERGIAVIDAGHYGVEKIFIPYLRSYLAREIPRLRIFEAGQSEPGWVA